MKEGITQNLTELHGQIADACQKFERDMDDITIVGVTKTHPASTIRTAVACGIHNIGESRIQEAEPKIRELGQIARFHLVGHLQTNKVKTAVGLFDVIQSVDSYRLATEINQRAVEIDRVIECYVEVNCSGEAQKYGVPPNETLDLIKKMMELPQIRLAGLMTVGPLTENEDEIRAAFARTRALFEQGRQLVGEQFDTLSMGMSNDFPLAIAEGSTMIRIGTGIFGPRS